MTNELEKFNLKVLDFIKSNMDKVQATAQETTYALGTKSIYVEPNLDDCTKVSISVTFDSKVLVLATLEKEDPLVKKFYKIREQQQLEVMEGILEEWKASIGIGYIQSR